jgi:hypothetical protein
MTTLAFDVFVAALLALGAYKAVELHEQWSARRRGRKAHG